MPEGFSCSKQFKTTAETGGTRKRELSDQETECHQSSAHVLQWLLGPWAFCDSKSYPFCCILSGRIIPPLLVPFMALSFS